MLWSGAEIFVVPVIFLVWSAMEACIDRNSFRKLPTSSSFESVLLLESDTSSPPFCHMTLRHHHGGHVMCFVYLLSNRFNLSPSAASCRYTFNKSLCGVVVGKSMPRARSSEVVVGFCP